MDFQIERLRRVPQRPKETWQGGFFRIPAWTQDEDGSEPYRSRAVGWISLKTRLIHIGELYRPKDKSIEMALETLTAFACNNELAGYRPTKLQVKDKALAEYLSELLADVDIEVELRDKLFAFDEALADMAENLNDKPILPNALDAKGVTVESMRAFAEAAAQFYNAKVWEQLEGDDLIEIESPFVGAYLRYVSVLGAGGETFGLGFYDSERQFESIFQRQDPESLIPERHWSVFFETIMRLPFGDADLWQDYKLPVADEDAYPIAVCWDPGGKHRRPRADILAFLEGLMKALAQSTEEQIDTERWQKSVKTIKGTMEFALSLPYLFKEDIDDTEPKSKIKGSIPDRRVMEREMANVHRLLEQHEFEDPDQMNEFLQERLAADNIPHLEPTTSLEKAQELVYKAFESHGRKQLLLAKKALEICPDCADAYVVLAERCSDPKKAFEYYAQGLAAGERALGKDFFEVEMGNFWGILETRPYMRARLGLAQCLEAIGKVDEAAEHYCQLLRLNPNDNQGVRDMLLSCLLETDRDAEADKLLKKYKNDKVFAMWNYTRALVTFRQKGNTATARKHLQKALEVNDYVLDYLLGYEELPNILPEAYSPGSEEEAVLCTYKIIDTWDKTPGAMDWLEEYADDEYEVFSE